MQRFNKPFRQKDFQEIYRHLQARVIFELEQKVKASTQRSDYFLDTTPYMSIDHPKYEAVVFTNDILQLSDDSGYLYAISILSLSELIEIL